MCAVLRCPMLCLDKRQRKGGSAPRAALRTYAGHHASSCSSLLTRQILPLAACLYKPGCRCAVLCPPCREHRGALDRPSYQLITEVCKLHFHMTGASLPLPSRVSTHNLLAGDRFRRVPAMCRGCKPQGGSGPTAVSSRCTMPRQKFQLCSARPRRASLKSAAAGSCCVASECLRPRSWPPTDGERRQQEAIKSSAAPARARPSTRARPLPSAAPSKPRCCT